MIKKILILVLFIIGTLSNAMAFSVIRDEEVESVLKDLTVPIYRAAGLPTLDVKLYIINDEAINAFVPGGYNIFVTTGLLTFSADPETFIGVIAHEVGHITSGHVLALKEELQNLRKKMIASMLLGAVAGVAGGSSEVGIGTMMAGSGISEMQFYKFNRVQESSADSAALKYLDKAGVNNVGLLKLLEKFKIEERSFDNSEFSYMRTHPVSQERITSIKNYNEFHTIRKSGFLTENLRKRFKRAVVKLEAFTSNPKDVLKQYSNPDDVNDLYAQSIAYYRMGNIANSLAKLDRAIEIEPKNPFFYELKGQIFFENGRVDDAVKNYATAYSYDKKAMLIKLSYASALIYAKKNLEKAVAILESISDEDRENDLVWRELGLAYDALHDKVKSNLAFAREAALKGDVISAKKFLATVKQSSPDNPRIKDIQLLIEEVQNSLQNDNS